MAQIDVQTPPQPPARRPPAQRPRRSLSKRMAQSARIWLKSALERDNLIAGLKSLGWVSLMTVIIWVYAEREQTSKVPVQFRIDARNNDGHRLVVLRAAGTDGRETSDFTVHADLTGPNARLEHVKELIEGGGLQVQIPDFDQPGDHVIPLASLLVDDPEFKDEGITPSNIAPSQIHVLIDPIETRKIDVVVRPNAAANIDGPVAFKPPAVEITGPKSVLEAARKEGKLVAYAELPNLTEPGSKSLPSVNVTIPFSDSHVHLETSSVSANYTLKSPDIDGFMHGVPVLVSYPAGDFWEKYKAVVDPPSIPDVKVTGPADVIADVDKPDYPNKPKAFLDLSHVDPPLGSAPVPGTVYKAPLLFDLGNTGLKVSADAKSLTFTVQPRNQ